MNSVSKFRARVLPTVNDYFEKNNSLPKPFVFSMACLIEYYKTNDVQDDKKAVEVIKNGNTEDILKNTALWGTDLTAAKELVDESLERIHIDGIREAIAWSMS